MIGTISTIMMLAAPILIIATGGMICERSGVTNVGLDGLMSIGACTAAIVHQLMEAAGVGRISLTVALLVAALVSMLISVLHAIASVDLKADQTISGTAINMLSTALTMFLAQTITGSGNITIVRGIIRSDIPLLSSIPVLGPLFFSQTYWTTWLCLGIWGISYFLLYRTNFGLRLRACGEHPSAVASAGINVHRMRYIGVLLSGVLSGLGGAVILVTYAGEYNSGAGINGLGFLAIAALIFGQWKPLGILGSTAFFGLFMTIANVGRVLPGISEIPTGFLGLFPYFATLVALVFSSRKSAAPLASGQPF